MNGLSEQENVIGASISTDKRAVLLIVSTTNIEQ